MSSRWDERGTGSDGRPRPAEQERTTAYLPKSYTAEPCSLIFVEKIHTDYPRRQTWIPLDTRSVVTVTAAVRQRHRSPAGQPSTRPSTAHGNA
jgi:hypothetical protein